MELASTQALVDAADGALYMAKENGRHRTEYRAVSELT
jgi:PleD family two-component response regulator